MAASETKALSAAAPLFSTAGACSAHVAQHLPRRTHVRVLLSSAGPMIGLPLAALCSWSDASATNAGAACKAGLARSAAVKAAARALVVYHDHRACTRPFVQRRHAARACALQVALRCAASVATAVARRT